MESLGEILKAVEESAQDVALKQKLMAIDEEIERLQNYRKKIVEARITLRKISVPLPGNIV